MSFSSEKGSRRGSISITGKRRGSGTEKLETHIVSWHTSSHKHEQSPHAREEELKQHLERFQKLFTITPQRLRMITDRFVGVLEQGLQKPGQTVSMLPAYVFGWPSGDELGSYLVLDLGGTNLRVCHVVLKGAGKFEITQSKFRLTEEQKQTEGQKLFDFCADCLGTFIRDHFGDQNGNVILEEDLALGFTFSYPMEQESIDHGKLVRWTKGFGNPNTEGRDCAAMFRKSLAKYKLPVKLVSIINDTTGTLIASNYVNHETRIACIFGTGCNAAYMERLKEMPKIKHLGLPEDEEMAVNCEYGAFDSFKHEHMAEIRTKYDEHIDLGSNKPHEQSYEKMIAGLYLGEIFRLCICDLIDEGVLFLGQNTYKLEKTNAFDTAFLSLIEADPTDELLTIAGLFTHFFGIDTTIEERQFFSKLAKLIGTRSARLSSCGIAALVTKMGYLDKGCGVGCDGSLYSKYPGFPDRLHQALEDIFGDKGRNIKTYQAEDGSGVGSAIIAAMTKARKEQGKPTTHFKLNSGASIPSVGLGTWQSPKGEVRDAVCHALKSGYRHIDCAWGYQNEDEVGEGIKLSRVPREEIWITSKLFEFHHNHVRQAVQDTLDKLGVKYLDLYLMHWNIAFVPEDVPAGQLPRDSKKDPKTGKHLLDLETTENFVQVWKEMEKLVDEGLVKNIGISNFSIRRTKELLKSCRIKPVVNQVELSFTYPQPELVKWLKSQDILPQAYSPLGSTGASQASLTVVDKIAKKHNVQGANVLISWQVARGCNPLPKSVTPARIENNLKLVDLDQQEIDELEKGALAQHPKKVCDQSDLVVPAYDIFEANHPTNNDKVQATLP
ncbi:probable hexokinase [Ustilago bromivora]|uniref:hexokinase n=1 Tax=Ustilago bromivora TaxID=307758 RepID=A0A8H8QLN4_9BASI|nr:probable hexokinase [Ustilago bromivora]